MWGFTEHPASGATEQHITVVCLETGSTLKGSAIEKHLDNALRNQIETLLASKSITSAQKTVLPPGLIPIAVGLGRFVFDQFAERIEKKFEELKAAASQSYSGTVIFESGAQLRKQIGFLLIRHKKDDDAATFAALLKIRQRGGGKALTIEPMYVRAVNAVAITSKDAGAISASMALAIKSLSKTKDGLVELVAAGQGAVTVSKLEIGPKTKPFVCADDCPGSDLIPYPPDDEPCSVSFAVTETGDVGFDIDARIAETKALKEALGPAITEALTEALKKKEE